ncbi:hypothetical protein K431DRAFT_315434 [Polychaeton citri CBS 116435]|uniref:Nucleoporin Pom152 n=1 Tax=Polychaeton citri CBS 116435 TaxID=1314669 RepID=A0A9P4Q3Q3_9PEZI|nr:hypothetical protein K431DRAFT_315434 [Polychaeton citri CBS 116435]
MNGTPRTPRLRSAFPSTPARGSEYGRSTASRQIPNVDTLKPAANHGSGGINEPLIPTRYLDAPTQRLYAVAVYVALFAWRVLDFAGLKDAEEQSFWLFLKWLFIDGVFLFALPELRIPWLEWDTFTMTAIFAAHAIMDGMMMFQIPIPIGALWVAAWRSVWGYYEIAVNEHNVNPFRVTHNESLILGRQIIHILPEGSAILNPDRKAFCLDLSGGPGSTDVRLPIMINSTNPTAIDIARIDLETQTEEITHLGKSDIKRMHKEASRHVSYSDKPDEPKTLFHTVRKPGLYVLAKVVDESNLEVARKNIAHTAVVPCPRAAIKPTESDRCKGDFSSIDIEVVGTPPLKVKYRKMVNRVTQDSTFESIMPEDYFTPLSRHQHEHGALLPANIETQWARSRYINVPLSESLGTAGKIIYSIEEVKDGFGNNISYSDSEHAAQEKRPAKKSHIHQSITVHERPTVQLNGCSNQRPLKIAKGNSASMPIQYGSTGRGSLTDSAYHLRYTFMPEDGSPSGADTVAQLQEFSARNTDQAPQMKYPGFYSLTQVSSDFCSGDVLEPASCLLQNPPEPDLSITTEEIFDKCAGSPIGLRVGLDLIGTPPFDVQYRMTKKGERHHSTHMERAHGLRGQLELTPHTSGHYTYEFVEISDAVYSSYSLKSKRLLIEQDVKPSASASFINAGRKRIACIDSTASFDVSLQGEGPFKVEYETVHAGKRTKKQIETIENDRVTLTTDLLTSGGEYVLTLTSVTDRMGCKEFLKNQATVEVKHQKPKVGFGHIEGRRSVDFLEGKKVPLPIRLAGEAPWTIEYLDAQGRTQSEKVSQANDKIAVGLPGTYRLLDVRDALCPGTVDDLASKFEVSLIPRPEMRVAQDERMEQQGKLIVRQEVCEGEDDTAEIFFKGSAPYHANYVLTVKPDHGAVAPRHKELRAALNVAPLRMETNQAGIYKYDFSKLDDANYDHNNKHFSPLSIQQRVNARPSAAFVNPGKTYSYCSVESDGEEVIPISLQGAPPFELEVEIKHYGSGKPESQRLSGIKSYKHDIKVPRRSLQLGKSQIFLRRVSDARGCSRILDSTSRVQISVHDAPTVSPLENQEHYCIGERINFQLAGTPPYTVFYSFEGQHRKAQVPSSTFRRLAEKPGTFVITGLQDSASQCKSSTNIAKHIHGMPSVRVSKGRDTYVDIHEGGQTEIQFDFGGEPPFEFTWTRSTNAERGKKSVVLDMKSEISEDHSLKITAGQEGTYEVVSIRDRHCSYSKPGFKGISGKAQKLLEN